MIDSVVFISDVQQSDAVIHIRVPLLGRILFPYNIILLGKRIFADAIELRILR